MAPSLKPKVNLKAIALVAGSVACLSAGYLLLFGPQTVILWEMRRWQSENATLASLPRPLPDTSVSQARGAKLTYFGYEFETPWADFEKDYVGSHLAIAYFRSGEFVMFKNPAHAVDFLKEMPPNDPQQAQKLRAILGGEVLESNYSLCQAALDVSPAQLSVFMSRRDALRLNSLLIVKGILAFHGETGLFSFAWDNVRGFQAGDPAGTDYVVVHAFERDDRQFEFTFGVKSGSSSRPSQAAINRVMQTLRPVAPRGQ